MPTGSTGAIAGSSTSPLARTPATTLCQRRITDPAHTVRGHRPGRQGDHVRRRHLGAGRPQGDDADGEDDRRHRQRPPRRVSPLPDQPGTGHDEPHRPGHHQLAHDEPRRAVAAAPTAP